MLLALDIVDEPVLLFLYSNFSICLALTYVFIPFVALSTYASLEKIDPSHIEASMDLGASGWQTFRRVILPLSIPGLIAGGTFTFCLSFGDFVTPTLLGGASNIMISGIIIGQFGAAFDWPFGSALAFVVLVVALTVVILMSLLERRPGVQIAGSGMASVDSLIRGTWAGVVLRMSSALTYLFLYLPIVVLVVFSFSESSILAFPITGFSLKWYGVLVHDQEMHRSITNSLIVAGSVVPLTILLGVPAAFALDRFSFPGKAAIERAVVVPLIVPQLITGIAILLVFKSIDMKLSLVTVVLGHAVAWSPIVITQVYARLRRLERSLEEASMDLGADVLRTFFRITLPNIGVAVTGSALLVFTLAFDDVAITFFLTGTENTLPMHIWSMLRRQMTPEINAIDAITVAVSMLLILAGVQLLMRARK